MRPWHSARAASMISTSRSDNVESPSRGCRDSADSSFSQLSSTKNVSVSLRITARSTQFGVNPEEKFDEQWNIRCPLAEWWNNNRNNIESVEKILTEGSGSDGSR